MSATPCEEPTQLTGAIDEDNDGLDDRAELMCGLEDKLDPLTSDLNADGVSDADACLSLTPVQPMLTLRPHEGALLGVELWLSEPVEELRPQLLELYFDYSADVLRLTGHETGEAASSAGLNAFAAELGDQVRLTLTGFNVARAAEGHLATLFFERTGEGELSFDTEVWQVAPSHIGDHLTFGEGSPDAPLSLP
jgi:hypothetical protein